ncbi:MAG: helix-turn-helix domain-containing protein [Ruminococcus flavefaciens]|nr:helix-turn-helix domain-containing protein [Ruminococcus flavefaciens]
MTDDTGKRIKARRRELGITQEELGKKAGVTKATINKYETGIVSNLKRSTIEEIAKALNVSPSYIMGWTDNIAEVHTNNGVIGQNSGTVTVNNAERTLSKEELELLRIYNKIGVRGRIRLIEAALELEEEKY